ncbi:MAG: tetratricopeptide repeat protein [Planctomycetales bacterium]|nr:tetratricopeptide repeat protein [Planctomycetales bacterium]
MPHSRRLLAACVVASAVIVAGGCGVIADTHNRHGVRSVYQGDYNAGMNSFQRALAKEPTNSDAYYNMAATLHQLGKQTKNSQYLSQAQDLYRRSLSLDNRHVDSYRGLAVLLAETQQSEEAFRLLRGWTEVDPANPEAHTELARLHQEFGNLNSAVDELQYALKVDYQNSRALAALGQLREKQGDTAQALANYRRAYNVTPRPELAAKIASLERPGAFPGALPGTTSNGSVIATGPLTTRPY